MTYFSLTYAFLFLPLVIILYNLTPKRLRFIVLLLANITFFIILSKHLIIYLVLSILSVYLSGLLISKLDKEKEKVLESTTEDKKLIKQKYKNKKKIVLILCILFNISFLFFFKYMNFFKLNTNLILNSLNIDFNFNLVKYIAPIGISFYTLSALAYIIDVYNGKIEADKNFFKVALYLSFFPQIMEGPIVRYSETSNELYEGKSVTYESICFGYQRILYGFFKKMIIADRLNIVVKLIFNNYTNYSGIAILLGVISYTVMLYMEFSGTMDVILGTGDILNVKIPENFRQPFFAKNISEFWSRWHISLGTWFKDYIFYPVSLSRPMKKLTVNARKKLGRHFGPIISGAVALISVWLLNGLWHGAGWTFIFYGIYMFALILLGNIFEPLVKKICTFLHINRENIFYRIFQSIKMTMLVFIGELFFRAPTLSIGFGMLKKIFTNFKLNESNELLKLGLDKADYFIIILGIIVVFIISLLKEKKINIRESISKKNITIRWIIYISLILAIIVFGAYGPGYIPVDPIYADF